MVEHVSDRLEAYQNIRQASDSLVEFNWKYRNIVSQLEISEIRFDPKLYVLDFLKKIGTIYGDSLCDVLNNLKSAPTTVEKVYQMAGRLP